MSVVFVDPQRDGTAVLELNGITHLFPSWSAAVAESRRLGLTCRVGPFPPLSVNVVAEMPAPTRAST